MSQQVLHFKDPFLSKGAKRQKLRFFFLQFFGYVDI